MPDLTSPDGQPVNAVYGFFAMFLNIMSEQKPHYLAVAFDRSKPTIRQSMYAGYHAHRPQMADGLSSQISIVDDCLDTLGVPTFAMDGYEGDDLIGTLATKVQSEEFREKYLGEHDSVDTIIVTGDRDMLQLVNEHTFVWMPIVGLTKSKLYDAKAVEEKYGVRPDQFIDYKALIGDASDGYPGVTGIGPKTAANLLREYSTFENLYQSIGVLPEKIGLKLATDAEQAALAKKLATIITDAPFTPDFSKTLTEKFDFAALRDCFVSLGFRSLVARLESRNPEIKKVPVKKHKKKVSEGQMNLEL
jgi:DNA polymerase I